MILVSACLLGSNCKYSGGNNKNEAVCRFLEEREHVLFCPEQAGGLPTPRLPSEIRNGGVYARDGADVTAQFQKGAADALALCREKGITEAILKEGSPSCGCHLVYDGTFSGTKISGQGITAALLSAAGIRVFSENDIEHGTIKEN